MNDKLAVNFVAIPLQSPTARQSFGLGRLPCVLGARLTPTCTTFSLCPCRKRSSVDVQRPSNSAFAFIVAQSPFAEALLFSFAFSFAR
jgi:hypothetical protein